MPAKNDVRIIVAGRELSHWVRYDIESDVMGDADAFSVSIANPGGVHTAHVSYHDVVEVLVDGTVQMTGYVDKARKSTDPDSGSVIEITGRDQFGMLVDISADPVPYSNKNVQQLAELISTPWVDTWKVDNEKNRRSLLQARSSLARYKRFESIQNVTAPVVPAHLRASLSEMTAAAVKVAAANRARVRATVFPTIKVQPGESILKVLKRVAERADLMLWMAADGTGVIARPNYDQKAIYRLQLHPSSSRDAPSNNVKSGAYETVGIDMFSEYRAVGTTKNTKNTSGAASIVDITQAATSPLTRTKLLSVQGKTRAQINHELARQVQLARFASETYEAVVPYHSQNGLLYQVDTIADVDDRVNGALGPWWIQRRRFVGEERGGQTTSLMLRRPGILLP